MSRICIFALAGLLAASAQAQPAPYRALPGLFDASRPDDLGLKAAPGTQTFTIFRPRSGTMKYNNGVVLMSFRGRLYAQWQSSAKDEDSSDTFVAYSRSSDGEHWGAPLPLAPRSRLMHSSGGPAPPKDSAAASEPHSARRSFSGGGWWTDGKTLVAFINVWPGGHRQGGHTEFRTSTDGLHWSKPKPVTDNNGNPVNGVIEQDPHALPGGRIIAAFHLRPGLIVSPFYTDDPRGIGGWTKGSIENLPHAGTMSRELEPSWFKRRDETVVMVFRDQESSFRQLASESDDRGASWTTPALTDMPDSRAKQSAGNLPDGTAFLVNEPSGNKNRIPLVVSLSKDGRVFDKAFVLRRGGADLQPLRHQGKYKRPGYHYPKSLVWKGWIYVSYATNKEDVELTRVPLTSLAY